MRNTRNTTVAVSDSGESEEELKYTPERGSAEREASQPHSILSHRFRESKEAENRGRKSGSVESQIAVMVSGPARPWEYRKYRGDTTVESVLKELKRAKGRTEYEIEYEDGTNATVSGSSFPALVFDASLVTAFNFPFLGFLGYSLPVACLSSSNYHFW